MIADHSHHILGPEEKTKIPPKSLLLLMKAHLQQDPGLITNHLDPSITAVTTVILLAAAAEASVTAAAAVGAAAEGGVAHVAADAVEAVLMG